MRRQNRPQESGRPGSFHLAKSIVFRHFPMASAAAKAGLLCIKAALVAFHFALETGNELSCLAISLPSLRLRFFHPEDCFCDLPRFTDKLKPRIVYFQKEFILLGKHLSSFLTDCLQEKTIFFGNGKRESRGLLRSHVHTFSGSFHQPLFPLWYI